MPKVFFYLPYLFNDTLNVSFKHKECTIMGDTNISYLDKNNHNDIENIFMLYGYKQLVTKTTRIKEDCKTLISTIFTNKPENKKPTPYRPVYPIMIWLDVSEN